MQEVPYKRASEKTDARIACSGFQKPNETSGDRVAAASILGLSLHQPLMDIAKGLSCSYIDFLEASPLSTAFLLGHGRLSHL